MSASNPNPPFNDPSYSRERLELETRVLAAALRQSLEIGDTEGSSLAHEQIFLLLKASQEMVIDEPISLPREVFIDRGRQLPDIDWGGGGAPVRETGDQEPVEQQQGQAVHAHQSEQYDPNDFAPPQVEPVQLHNLAEERRVSDDPAVTTSPDLDSVDQAAGPLVYVEDPSQADYHAGFEDQDVTEALPETQAQFSEKAHDQAFSETQTHDGVDAVPGVMIEAHYNTGPAAAADQRHGEAGLEPAPVQAEQEQNQPQLRQREIAPVDLPINDNEADYYLRLNVTDLADFHSIHLSFWRMMRRLLKDEAAHAGPDKLFHLKRIQRIWIAHDILCDPVTRADYDFRRMGLRGGENDEDGPKRGSGPRQQLRIGELLQCAGLLEQNELDIAADMHKAMPEIMFGTFLVKQGFVDQSDLDCVLIGQQLLKQGDITVVQFQTVMIERSATGLDIGEMLLAKGYVTQTMLDRAYRSQSDDTLVKMPALQLPSGDSAEAAKSGAEAPGQGQTLPQANPRNDRSLKLSNAAPPWKDQLDWSAPDSSSGAPGVVSPQSGQTEAGAGAPHTMDEALAASVRAIAEIWGGQPAEDSSWADSANNPFVAKLDDTEAAPVGDQQYAGADEEPVFEGPDPGYELIPITAPSPFITPDEPPAAEEETAQKQLSNAPKDAGVAPTGVAPTGGAPSGAARTSHYRLDGKSEIETSGQLPSLGELELKAKGRGGHEEEKGRGSQEEENDPAALTSGRNRAVNVQAKAFPNSQAGQNDQQLAPDPTRAKESTGNMQPFVDSEDQPAEADRPSGEFQQPDAANEAAEPESRRARRRRTRH